MFMKRSILCAIFAFSLMTGTGNAVAQESWPDMKGTWTATSSTVVIGGEKHHPGSVDKNAPRFREVKFTFNITEQKDRRFSGTLRSEHHSEALIGVLYNKGKQVLMADSDGFMDGTVIDANSIEYCYRHSTRGSVVVACNIMKREVKP